MPTFFKCIYLAQIPQLQPTGQDLNSKTCFSTVHVRHKVM